MQEIEDGIEVTIHDDFDRGIKAICQKHVGKKCPYCKDEDMRTRTAYFFSVWDHESKEVKLFEGYANNFNPLPSLVANYETFETLMDRDYMIQRDGSGTNTRYSVVSLDKVRFKNTKAKPFTKKKALEILDKAYPVNEDDLPNGRDDDDDDDDMENENDTWGEDEDEEMDYDEMDPKELYLECKERGIKVAPKKKKSYYIQKLEEYDEEDYEEEDEDEEDDW